MRRTGGGSTTAVSGRAGPSWCASMLRGGLREPNVGICSQEGHDRRQPIGRAGLDRDGVDADGRGPVDDLALNPSQKRSELALRDVLGEDDVDLSLPGLPSSTIGEGAIRRACYK